MIVTHLFLKVICFECAKISCALSTSTSFNCITRHGCARPSFLLHISLMFTMVTITLLILLSYLILISLLTSSFLFLFLVFLVSLITSHSHPYSYYILLLDLIFISY